MDSLEMILEGINFNPLFNFIYVVAELLVGINQIINRLAGVDNR